jgi:hypothetical protein
MSKPDDEVPFLSRWSRLKQRAVRPGAPAEQIQRDAPTDAPRKAAASPDIALPAANAAPAKNDDAEPPLDLDKLPRIEDITAESDIAGFLDHRVPAALRNAALSRMWTLDPTIRDFIEVAENQWNWNIQGGAPFYELIEEGSTAGISFADATSAISRTLTSAGEPPSAAVPSADQVIEISDRQKVELAEEIVAAPQEERPSSDPSTISRAAPQPPVVQAVAEPEVEIAAAQQKISSARRRHGGALPA